MVGDNNDENNVSHSRCVASLYPVRDLATQHGGEKNFYNASVSWNMHQRLRSSSGESTLCDY